MMDEDEYAIVTKRPLKLADKDKKRKEKNKSNQGDLVVADSSSDNIIAPTLTKAEEAFRARQEKIAEERILKKASKTHKQRVEEFNKHLDSLSEHYDIPKVSWTK